MRLVLCDHNQLLSEALAAALETRGHEVPAITTTAADGLAAVAEHRPDVCVLELCFPDGADGLSTARVITERHQETKVLILSGVSNHASLSQSMRAGVAGFLRKDLNVNQIAEALNVIEGGGVVFDPHDTRPSRRGQVGLRGSCPPYALTPREHEVLRRIVAGQSTRQMASEMKVTTSTLRSYVKTVLTKLGAHSRLQAAVMARREDLLSDAATVLPEDGILHLA